MKTDPNEFLRQAVIRICGNLDIESAMKNCLDYLPDHIPVESIDFFIDHPELEMIEIVHSVSSVEDSLKEKLIPVPMNDHSIKSAKWPELESISIINDPQTDPTLSEFCRRYDLSTDFSLIILSLALKDEMIGLLSLAVTDTNRYTTEHAKLLLLLREPFAIAFMNSLRHQEITRLKDMLSEDYRYLQMEMQKIVGLDVIGADFGLKDVMNQVHTITDMDSPVLLLGETGAGKEIIAHAIHFSSSRKQGPFIRVNCGAIPDSLIDSELFGHEQGAFTGATTQKRGRFERANRGTIFLDEVGELPLQAQVHLLHVLQHGEIERVGGTEVVPLDVRIIFATHRNLERMTEEGTFRQDLLFRMNVFPITIPPLRDRKEDIAALVHHFIEQKSNKLKIQERPIFEPGSIDELRNYNWPGNVRELENLIERALIQYRGKKIDFKSLLPSAPETSKTDSQDSESPDKPIITLDQAITSHISQALIASKGKISGPGGAAEMLHIHPNTLREKMKKLNIPYRRKDSFRNADTSH